MGRSGAVKYPIFVSFLLYAEALSHITFSVFSSPIRPTRISFLESDMDPRRSINYRCRFEAVASFSKCLTSDRRLHAVSSSSPLSLSVAASFVLVVVVVLVPVVVTVFVLVLYGVVTSSGLYRGVLL